MPASSSELLAYRLGRAWTRAPSSKGMRPLPTGGGCSPAEAHPARRYVRERCPPSDEFYYPMNRRSLTTVEAKTQSVSASRRNTYGDAVNGALRTSHTRGMQPPPTGRGVRRQRSHPRGGAALGMLPPRLTVLAPHEAFTCDSESHVNRRKSGFGGQPHQRASRELGRGRLTGGRGRHGPRRIKCLGVVIVLGTPLWGIVDAAQRSASSSRGLELTRPGDRPSCASDPEA